MIYYDNWNEYNSALSFLSNKVLFCLVLSVCPIVRAYMLLGARALCVYLCVRVCVCVGREWGGVGGGCMRMRVCDREFMSASICNNNNNNNNFTYWAPFPAGCSWRFKFYNIVKRNNYYTSQLFTCTCVGAYTIQLHTCMDVFERIWERECVRACVRVCGRAWVCACQRVCILYVSFRLYTYSVLWNPDVSTQNTPLTKTSPAPGSKRGTCRLCVVELSFL